MTSEDLFTCTQCGFCCHGETTVSLDADDRKRMSEFLGLTEQETAAKYWRKQNGQVQMRTVDGHCVFYKDGCTVHKGRPWRCAQWPLHPSILLDSDNLKTIRESCPGITRDLSYEAFCRKLREIEK